MKSLYCLLALLFAFNFSYCQNTVWPSPTSNDRVGIGTTSPSATLHIVDAGTSGTTTLQLNSRILFRGDGVTNWGSNAAHGLLSWDGFKAIIGAQNGMNLALFANGAEKVTVTTLGNVGIGTTSPTEKLDVNGVINSNTDIISTNGTVKAFLSTSNSYNAGVVGTQTNHDFAFYINSLPVARFTTAGNFGIGTADTKGYKLAVNGGAIATSITVKLYADWPDYVFKPTYQLPKLSEVKSYIDQNQHLPDMPSEAEVKKDGINLGEMVKLQTKKIEELTLYLIEKDKEKKEQDVKIDQLKQLVETLSKEIRKN